MSSKYQSFCALICCGWNGWESRMWKLQQVTFTYKKHLTQRQHLAGILLPPNSVPVLTGAKGIATHLPPSPLARICPSSPSASTGNPIDSSSEASPPQPVVPTPGLMQLPGWGWPSASVGRMTQPARTPEGHHQPGEALAERIFLLLSSFLLY